MNLLNIKPLRNILFVSIIIILGLAFINIFQIYPSYNRLLVVMTQREAIRTTRHFAHLLGQQQIINNLILTDELIQEIQLLEDELRIIKIKVYSSLGRVQYSTDKNDLGKLNEGEYFKKVLSKGEAFSKLVHKSNESSESTIFETDIIETYVPVLDEGVVVGAVEVYYDITEMKEGFQNLFIKSAVILAVLSFSLMVIIVLSLMKASTHISRQEEAEETLRMAHDELEIRVQERAAQLSEANKKLKEELIERARAEEALRKSEESYRNIITNMDEGYLELDLAGNVTFANEATRQIIGLDNDELIGMSYKKVVTPDVANKLFAGYSQVYSSGKSHRIDEFVVIHTDKTSRYVESFTSLKKNEQGEVVGFCGILHDVTEREKSLETKKRLENQLQHAIKMESLGTLASGIAHDFNNLLMGIQGNTSLMMLDISEDNIMRPRLKTIEDLVRSGADLTRQLLGFARGGMFQSMPTDLNGVVEKSINMFARTRKELKITTKLQPDIWPAEVDPGQIEQVLLNLFVNASQAMLGGGRLDVETENCFIDPEKAESLPFIIEPGKYVNIQVEDNGVGMDLEIQQRIFDPFFTTKEKGRGTGLGLASAYGIIKKHGGVITVESEKGNGTKFNLYLPVAENAAKKEAPRPKILKTGRELILLIDDEQTILEVGRQMLETLGYQVITANSGESAVAIFEKEHEAIDMVILDLIMPDLNGEEVFYRMIRIDQDIPILLASGFSMAGQAEKMMQQGCKGYLQKPFNLEKLSYEVREILGG